MVHPDQLPAQLARRFRPEWRLVFFSAFGFGLLAHFYKMANWLPNWDSLVFRYDAQQMLQYGRYFLSLACGLSSYYDLPWLNLLLGLLFLAGSAVCVAALLHLKKPVTLVLTGALIAVFPTVTSTFAYEYVADGYCLAMLAACLSALLLTRPGWRSFFAGAACLWFSVGIYQAYLTVTITLLLVWLLDDLLFHRRSAAASLRSAGRFLAGGVLAGAVYAVALQLVLAFSGTALSDYQGIDTVGSLHLWSALHGCITRFFRFFFDLHNGLTVWFVLNVLVFALLAVFLLTALVQQTLWHDPARFWLLLVYLAALPLGAAALYFLNPWVDYHNLMTMGYAAFYLCFVLFYERLDGLSPRASALRSWAILLVGGAVVFYCIVLANVCYHLSQMSYERSYGTLLRIADRIEQLDGADACTRIAVIGHLPDSRAYSADLSPEMTGYTAGLILRADDPTVGQSVLTAALNDYCSTDYTFATRAEKQQLLALDEVRQMPLWPQTGSVAVVGDTIVIRAGEGIDAND